MNAKYDSDLVVRAEQDAENMLRALDPNGADDAPCPADESTDSNGSDSRYEVESRIAEGGFGAIESVTDRRLRRTVARKRLRADAPPLLSREIRILSQLQHPNILPLYEALFASDGRAEGYTMPLLTGETLHGQAKQFHANRPLRGSLRLSLAPLLNAFADVCRAIGYAHSRGIWHLDLKGSNVLVDASGAAVVIDWNMALTDDEPPLAEQAPGTPGFQAPEQASRGIVGPATDIHGLGALLYELLTGHAPYGGADPESRTCRARAGPPEPPSNAWPAVPKALEAICLKAMAPDPADRFRDPEDMRIEVDRWRNDEAVRCMRESALARLARWGRRHPRAGGVILTLLIATLPVLVGWLVYVEQQRQVTAAALDDARASFAEVLRAGDRYFTTMSNNRRLQRDGLQPLRRTLLADGLDFYQEFLERRGDTPELRREIAIGWSKLAWLLARDESRGRAGPAAQRALDLLESELDDTAAADEQLMLWKAKAIIVLAESRHDKAQPDAALAALNRFDDWVCQMGSQPGMSEQIEWLTARAQFVRASVLADRNPADALPMLGQARAAFERIASDEPTEENTLALASILTKEGSTAIGAGNLDQARRLLSHARQVYQELLDRPDPLPTTRRGMSTVEHLLGLVEFESGNDDESRRHLLNAFQERQELAARNPDNKYLCHVASTAVALARLHRRTGPAEDADFWLLRAHGLLRQCIDDQHPNSHLWGSAIDTHCRAGWILLRSGRPAESLEAFLSGLAVANRAVQAARAKLPGR